jgi:hypothetical protein
MGSRLAEPMREYCANLTEVVIQSGHLMAQECPVAVNAACEVDGSQVARRLGVVTGAPDENSWSAISYRL